jgi:hypothetical protein
MSGRTGKHYDLLLIAFLLHYRSHRLESHDTFILIVPNVSDHALKMARHFQSHASAGSNVLIRLRVPAHEKGVPAE